LAAGGFGAGNIEAVFKSFADTIPHMIWSCLPDGYGDYYNKRWYDFTGAEPDAAVGHGWDSVMHPEDRAAAWEAWRRSMATGEDFQAEYRLRHRSGDHKWVLARASAARNAGGRIERWFGTCTLIHDAKATEAALAESEERYRALVEASAAMVWRASPDGLVLKGWGWESVSGQSPEEYEGEGWIEAVHPDDRDRVAEVWRSLLADPRPGATDYRVRTKDGAHRWFHVRTVPLKAADGSVREWVGTVSDIHERKQAEECLRRSEERLRLAVGATGIGIWDVDIVTGEKSWTEETCAILGLPKDVPLVGATFLERVHPEDREEAEARFVTSFPPEGTGYDFTCRIVRADDGEMRWVVVNGRTIVDEDGRPIRKIGTIQDVTERKRSDEALRASEERLRLALHAARMFAWEEDIASRYVMRSQNSVDLLGIGSGPLGEFLERVHPDDRWIRDDFSSNAVLQGSAWSEFRYLKPDGETIWLASRAERTSGGRIVGVTYDITERKAAEEEIRRTADHDPLTGLPNRILFQRRLDEVVSTSTRTGLSSCLLLIDLDDFKEINDTFGHDAGDELLKVMADRLVGTVGDGGTVARLGGDEFAMLVADCRTSQCGADLARRVIASLQRAFIYEERTHSIRASIGIAACPDHETDPSELMKAADLALYRAKAEGRNRVTVFSREMKDQRIQRVSLIREMRQAVAEKTIVPFYQPKVCLGTGRVVGFEALARWRHPEKGILTPEFFGSLFEDLEMAQALGRRIITSAAEDMRVWLDRGFEFGRVAVNLSSAEFEQADLADRIMSVLADMDIPSERFEVEVTETVLLGRSSDHVSAILRQLHGKGISIAMDDFGTGYASLTHLKQFPVDHVKIDRSFVRELERDQEDEAIVAAVIGLGRGLRLHVTAEGIETEGQARRLLEMGCHGGQGYLYARPMPAADVPGFLSRWQAWPQGLAQAGE